MIHPFIAGDDIVKVDVWDIVDKGENWLIWLFRVWAILLGLKQQKEYSCRYEESLLIFDVVNEMLVNGILG